MERDEDCDGQECEERDEDDDAAIAHGSDRRYRGARVRDERIETPRARFVRRVTMQLRTRRALVARAVMRE
jgi:hypothetical protein